MGVHILMKKKLLLGLISILCLVTALSVSGCSSSGGSTTINVAADTTFPPFESETKDGKVTGFDIDMIKAIADKENLKLKFHTMNFTGIIPALQAHSVDVAVAGITIKKSRMGAVNFSDAYYKSGASILVLKKDASKISTLKDLDGKTVATKKGTSSVDILKKEGNIKIKQFDNIDNAYNDLLSGGSVAVVFDNPVNSNFASSNSKVQIVGSLLSGEYYGIAVDKSKSDLLKKINDGLAAIRKDGTFDKIYKQYFGNDKNGIVKAGTAPGSVALSS